MRLRWVGVALLAASWLVGLGYYHHPDWITWSAMVLVGAALLASGEPLRIPVGPGALALLLSIIAAVLAPWPYSLIAVLLALGSALLIVPVAARWTLRVGTAAALAGAVLAMQAVAILAYQSVTGRSHELPWPLPQGLSGIASLLGAGTSVENNNIVLHTMRRSHELGATWDLLLDPATFCFLAGGIVALALTIGAIRPRGTRLRPFLAQSAILALCVLAWLPVRAALLMALLLHRALRTEFESPLKLMDQFWSTPLLMLLPAGPVVLAWRFVRATPSSDQRPQRLVLPPRRPAVALALAILAVLAIMAGLLWDPPGERKPGRVLVDESHSKWEPTQRPMDTEWYGQDSGYNYYTIYDYLTRFYDMGRIEAGPITDDTLRNCDVLIVKVPTSRYAPGEVDAIIKFIRHGGGLMLVGEHTDVFGTGTALNDIAARAGFRFRYDVILDLDTGFEQAMRLPLVPHPTLQLIPNFDFAVSCSIDPGDSSGRAVVLSRALRSLPPDYHASNFYPQIDDDAQERYGAMVQAWTTRLGRGRIFAWTDSTVFSNFCIFEPGKSELMLGTLEWLNHRDTGADPRPWLLLLGAILGACALVSARGWEGGWIAVLSAAVLAWSVALPALRWAEHRAVPAPQQLRPLHRLAIDRTLCDSILSRGGFIEGRPDGFGIFERWMLRLGYFTKRASGEDALHDDALVFMYPHIMPTPQFVDQVEQYVSAGGKLLVLDSPENQASTANSLLWPYKLKIDHSANEAGALVVPEGWGSPQVPAACPIAGGTPFIYLNNKPVAVTATHGKGSVTVVGFGSRFADANMGVTGDTLPDPDMRKVYDLEYAVIRALIESSPTTRPATTQPATAP